MVVAGGKIYYCRLVRLGLWETFHNKLSGNIIPRRLVGTLSVITFPCSHKIYGHTPQQPTTSILGQTYKLHVLSHVIFLWELQTSDKFAFGECWWKACHNLNWNKYPPLIPNSPHFEMETNLILPLTPVPLVDFFYNFQHFYFGWLPLPPNLKLTLQFFLVEGSPKTLLVFETNIKSYLS